METSHVSLGKNLAHRRTRLKISREELATAAGISVSMLSKIERDKTNPTVLVAKKLARALNTTVSALLGERPDEQLGIGDIEKFIGTLSGADKQLETAIALRRELDPDFQATFDRNYIFDKDCRYLFASIAAADTFGRSRCEIVGKHWRELGLPAEVMEELESNIRAVFSSGQPLTAEATLSGPKGFDYFEYRLKPLLDGSGDIAAVMGTVKSITEKKLSELGLRNHYVRLTHIVDSCPSGIIAVDRYGTINTFNKAAREVLAPYSSKVWLGKDVYSLMDWLGVDHGKSALIKALAGEGTANARIQALGRLWLTSASPLADAAGVICGALVFFQPLPATGDRQV